MTVKNEKTFIRLLNSTDVREQAWRISRPYIKDDELIDLGEIGKADISVNSLKILFFHIRSSAAFRELITSIRPYFLWAQTSRVNPVSDVSYDFDLLKSIYSDQYKIDEIINRHEDCIKRINNGEHQDQVRLDMFISYNTEYVLGIDYRTLIAFLKSLKIFYPIYMNHYGSMILKLLNLTSDDIDKINYSPIFNIDDHYPVYDNDTNKVLYDSNNDIIIRCTIPVALRAQIVRHQAIRLVDNFFWNYGIHEDFIERVTNDASVDCTISCNKSTWKKLVNHRACWLAQFELYDNLISSYVEKEGLYKVVPCHFNKDKCPFISDMTGRIEGKDPGLVCPIYGKQYLDNIDKRKDLLGNSKILSMYKLLMIK